MGLNDAGKNNVWRFFDGTKYDVWDKSKEAAWHWGDGGDNSEEQNCAYVRDFGGSEGIFMTDWTCGGDQYGLCEIVTQSC